MAKPSTVAILIKPKIDWVSFLEEFRPGLVEVVARQRYAEYTRGLRAGGGDQKDFDDLPASQQAAWISTARDALEEML